MEYGITPGPRQPPVFETDFGTIGVQTCFDVNWHRNWEALRRAGAELVFWPAGFAGGEMLNGLAWINKYYIVSSTWMHATKIVNPLGDDVMATGRFEDWVCAPVNLDYAVIQGGPEIKKLDAVLEKYGRKFLVRTKHVEAWALIEGNAPDVSVPDVLLEFGIMTSNAMLDHNEMKQDAMRPA